MRKLLCIFTCILLLFSSVSLAEENKTDLDVIDFSANLADGTDFVLADHMGKVIFINIWATWCGPCVSELPVINELAEKYADAQDVLVLTVNTGDDSQIVQAFLQEKGYTMPTACDEDNKLLITLGANAIPVSVVIDKNGMVSKGWIGLQTSLDHLLDFYSTEIEALR